jgi:hypothetical protein
MLENRIFGAALFLASLLFLFHGCVLAFAPNRYLPLGSWGEPTIKLVRKPPREIGKRVFGLCLSLAILFIFTLPGLLMTLHPEGGSISFGNSPLPHGMARWDMLGLGLFAVVCGYLLLLKPERSVEMLFSTDKSKLEDKATRMLWKIYVQMGGSCCLA